MIQIGFKFKLYLADGGIGGDPEWSEVKTVGDVNVPLSKGEAEHSDRNDPWEKYVAGLKKVGAEFEIPWDEEAEAFATLFDSFLNDTTIGLMLLDGSKDTAGSAGLMFDAQVFGFDHGQPLKTVSTAKVSIKPTPSANAVTRVITT